jgi:hypothetical protein
VANPNVGQRGTAVTVAGRTLGFAWQGTGPQGWCAEYADPTNGNDVDTAIGLGSQVECMRWLAERILGALPGPPNQAGIEITR